MTENKKQSTSSKKSATAKESSSPDTVSPISANTVLEMSLPWLRVEPVYARVNKKFAKQIKLDGFRKGKVPPAIASQYLSPEKVIETTAEQVLQEVYPSFIQQSGKIPLGRPEFKIIEAPQGKDWKIQVSIAEKPVLDVSSLNAELKRIKKERLADAKSRKKLQAEAENKEKETAKPKLDVATQKRMDERKAEQEREQLLGFTYSRLILTFKPTVPELLVKQEAEEQLHNFGHQLEKFKITYEDYLRQRGQTDEQFMQEVTASALSRLQLAFLIDALITELKLTPDSEAVTVALRSESAEAQKYYTEHPEAQSAYANRLAQRALEDILLAD